MQGEHYSKSRVAKNTIILYLRMIVTIVIGLYTSRILLNALGFSDYGIITVVGGLVTMISFLRVGMSGAAQRFLSVELGKGDMDSLRNTFCATVLTHIVITIIGVIFLESLGLWFLNYKLNIPADRLYYANWVFQSCIISFAVTILAVPYNAAVIAHEHMGAFAYITIAETLFRFVLAFSLYYSPIDKLILYSILTALGQIIISSLYWRYCKKHFEECTFTFHYDKKLTKEMLSFAGWGFVGNMGFSTKDQLSNVLLNLFFDTTINAGRGIAARVSGVINSFAQNFTTALNPQIAKLYAAGEYEKSRDLVYAGSRYSFYLLLMIAVPFLTNEHYILMLWLGDIPPYTDSFVFIILTVALIYSMAHSTATAIMTTGKVRSLQLGLALILLSEIPIAYVMLKCGCNPWQALIPSIVTTMVTVLYRYYLITKYVPIYSFKHFIIHTVLRCLAIYAVTLALSLYIRTLLPEGFWFFIITSFISLIIVLAFVYAFGLTTAERQMAIGKVKSVLKIKK